MFRKKLKYMCYTIFHLSKILKKTFPYLGLEIHKKKMSGKHFFYKLILPLSEGCAF